MATFGIVVGGGPAPGINGVISAATLAARAAAVLHDCDAKEAAAAAAARATARAGAKAARGGGGGGVKGEIGAFQCARCSKQRE